MWPLTRDVNYTIYMGIFVLIIFFWFIVLWIGLFLEKWKKWKWIEKSKSRKYLWSKITNIWGVTNDKEKPHKKSIISFHLISSNQSYLIEFSMTKKCKSYSWSKCFLILVLILKRTPTREMHCCCQRREVRKQLNFSYCVFWGSRYRVSTCLPSIWEKR